MNVCHTDCVSLVRVGNEIKMPSGSTHASVLTDWVGFTKLQIVLLLYYFSLRKFLG